VRARLGSLILIAALTGCGTAPRAPLPPKRTVQPKPQEPAEPPAVPLATTDWDLAYAGFGSVEFHPPSEVVLSSRRTNSPQLTHGALVLSKRDFPAAGYEVEVDYTLNEQHRSPAPNPWETFWLFTNYQPWPSGKATNYVMVKPNGLEAGKAWSYEEQSFAVTRGVPTLRAGERGKLRVRLLPYGAMRIYFNDEFVSEVPPDRIYGHAGKLGLYSEDSRVTVHSVRLRWLTK